MIKDLMRRDLMWRQAFVGLALYFGLAGSILAEVSIELRSPRSQVMHFDLPGQPLSQGLLEFSLQSGVSIVVSHELLSGLSSSPVIGSFPTEQALRQLLSNAPLSFKYFDKTNAFLIQADEHLRAPEADQHNDSDALVERMLVSGIRYPFRYHTISNSQIHGNLSSFDTARFMNVLPAQVNKDQKPSDLNEALRNISSISPGDGLADSNDDFFIRGFPRYAVYVDGFRLQGNTGIRLMPANFERVEILKGPSTLYYGQAEPGGIVNVVRKKPMAKAHQKINFSAGNGERQLLDIDLTGNVIPAYSRLDYRLVYSGEARQEYRDLSNLDQELLATSLAWKLGQNALLSVAYDYQESSQIRDQGTIILTPEGRGINLVSLDQAARQKRPEFSAQFKLFNFVWRHNLGDTWRFAATYFDQKEERFGIRGSRDALLASNVLLDAEDLAPDELFILVGGIPILIDIGTDISGAGEQLYSAATIRSLYDEIAETDSKSLQLELEGSPNIAGRTHHLALGVEVYAQDLRESYMLEERSDIRSLSLSDSGTTNALDLIQGVFDNTPGLGVLNERSQQLDFADFGIYLQDNIEITPSLLSSFGARYTITKGERADFNSGLTTELETFREISTDVGLVFHPVQSLSLYFNFSESMKANYQIDDLGTNITEPELSSQFELGLKTLAFGDRLISTLAIFNIDKENIVDIQFEEGLRRARIGGEQTSQGIDFDFSYQLNRHLDVIGSWSAIDAKITSGPRQGNTPALVSKNTASLFLNANFAVFDGHQLDTNIGWYHLGERYGDNENSFLLDKFTTVDAGATYGFSMGKTRCHFQISAKNVFDAEYISAVEGAIRTNTGAGRSLTATIGLEM